jgi:hypothetical protein
MKEFKLVTKKRSLPIELEKNKSDEPLLLFRTANECIESAKLKPVPKMLFSEFWHEDEICILFADTNVGKSILAVQIADSISKGHSIYGFKMTAKCQKVLYFDFELSEKQFENRYSENYQNHYSFFSNFFRIEINPKCVDFLDFEQKLFQEIEQAIINIGVKVLIVDNLTYLKAQTTETSKEALPLMKLLKDLKLKYDLSILVLAHTPKRNHSSPININDIAGSRQLANFTDSAFAIGQSCQDKSYRYIKQIKARATEKIYESENVILCLISKNNNFLGFEFVGFVNEGQHLTIPEAKTKDELEESILEMKRDEPEISMYTIAQRLGTNKMKVKRVFERNGIHTSKEE